MCVCVCVCVCVCGCAGCVAYSLGYPILLYGSHHSAVQRAGGHGEPDTMLISNQLYCLDLLP